MTSGNWKNGFLGPWHWFPTASATEFPWTLLSSLQILVLLLGVIGPILGLKFLEMGSNPLQLLHGMSPETVTKNSGQGPSELKRMEREVGGFSWLQSANIVGKSF